MCDIVKSFLKIKSASSSFCENNIYNLYIICLNGTGVGLVNVPDTCELTFVHIFCTDIDQISQMDLNMLYSF